MSNEISQSNNVGQNLASYAMFPAATTAISAGIAVKTHGKNVIKSQNNEAFKKLNAALKNQTDTFTRSRALAETYEAYKDIAKKNAKLAKKLKKINKKKHLPIKEQIKNLFRSPDKKITLEQLKENIRTAADNASNTLKNVNEVLENAGKGLDKSTAGALEEALGIGVRETTKTGKAAARVAKNNAADKVLTAVVQEGAESAAKSNLKGLAKNFKKNFKNEVGFKSTAILNYAMTAIEFFPKIGEKIIPAFKEEGFIGGIKETGKTLVQAGTDLVGYAAGGSIGRVIGSAIGAIISPAKGVGAKVGGFIGDMIGSMIVGTTATKTVNKILGENEEPEQTTQPQVAYNQTSNNYSNPNAQQIAALDINERNLAFEQAKRLAKAEVYANYGITPRNNYIA